MIRKAINDCFYSLIHETFKFNGASELLDILASIISGFAVPLREEHIIFFKNVIKSGGGGIISEKIIRVNSFFIIGIDKHKDIIIHRDLFIVKRG